MVEVRCTNCNKLLYKIENPFKDIGDYVEIPKEIRIESKQPKIEIQCPRCKKMNTK